MQPDPRAPPRLKLQSDVEAGCVFVSICLIQPVSASRPCQDLHSVQGHGTRSEMGLKDSSHLRLCIL